MVPSSPTLVPPLRAGCHTCACVCGLGLPRRPQVHVRRRWERSSGECQGRRDGRGGRGWGRGPDTRCRQCVRPVRGWQAAASDQGPQCSLGLRLATVTLPRPRWERGGGGVCRGWGGVGGGLPCTHPRCHGDTLTFTQVGAWGWVGGMHLHGCVPVGRGGGVGGYPCPCTHPRGQGDTLTFTRVHTRQFAWHFVQCCLISAAVAAPSVTIGGADRGEGEGGEGEGGVEDRVWGPTAHGLGAQPGAVVQLYVSCAGRTIARVTCGLYVSRAGCALSHAMCELSVSCASCATHPVSRVGCTCLCAKPCHMWAAL
jgi:hypothetical protein